MVGSLQDAKEVNNRSRAKSCPKTSRAGSTLCAMGCVVNAFTITVADSIQRREISLTVTFPGVI